MINTRERFSFLNGNLSLITGRTTRYEGKSSRKYENSYLLGSHYDSFFFRCFVFEFRKETEDVSSVCLKMHESRSRDIISCKFDSTEFFSLCESAKVIAQSVSCLCTLNNVYFSSVFFSF